MGLTSSIDHHSGSVEKAEPMGKAPVHRLRTTEPIQNMEPKYRTLLQAAVLLILLVCVAASNGSSPKQENVTAQVAAND